MAIIIINDPEVGRKAIADYPWKDMPRGETRWHKIDPFADLGHFNCAGEYIHPEPPADEPFVFEG